MPTGTKAPSLAAIAAGLAAALDAVQACASGYLLPDLTRARIENALQPYAGYAG